MVTNSEVDWGFAFDSGKVSMSGDELHRERVVRVERPERFYSLVVAADGRYLAVADGQVVAREDVDDAAVWQDLGDGRLRHPDGCEISALNDCDGLAVTFDGAKCGGPRLVGTRSIRPRRYATRLVSVDHQLLLYRGRLSLDQP